MKAYKNSKKCKRKRNKSSNKSLCGKNKIRSIKNRYSKFEDDIEYSNLSYREGSSNSFTNSNTNSNTNNNVNFNNLPDNLRKHLKKEKNS